MKQATGNKIRIHRAVSKDFTSVCGIIEEYCNAIGVLMRDDERQLKQYLDQNAGVWLALDEVSVIGCAALRPLTLRADACEVKRLYVKESYRGMGIADALMDALERYAYDYGYKTAYLDTNNDLQAAIHFYKRRGYQECARYNKNPQATLFMCRELV